MKKVLNFGSLNIDYVYKVEHIVSLGETISSENMNVYPGGKGLNQSIALGKAGIQVFHAGSIGKEGEFLIKHLENAGVDTRYIKVFSDRSSGHAIIQNDSDGDNCIILFGGTNQEITLQQIDDVLVHFGEGDYLILQNEINNLEYIVEKAYDKHMIIVLNPSPMNDKILKLDLNKISYFILNEIEAGQITNSDTKDIDQLEEVLRRVLPDAKIVLTLGKEGARYIDSKTSICQSIYKVKTVDTTAAGDTFTGYFIAGMMGNKSIEESLDLSARASAIAVSRNGAGVSIPTIQEVENMSLIQEIR